MKEDLISTLPRDVLFALMLTNCPEWLLDCGRISWRADQSCPPCLIGKLSRKWLFSLPPGVWIASNCGHTPVFASEIAPGPFRRMQWEHIKILGADQRQARIFASESDFQDHLAKRENSIGMSLPS